MDYPNHITDHEKGKRLTYEDYVAIELRLKDGWKPNAIAKKELHCAPNTVRNIIKKGMTPLYNGKVLLLQGQDCLEGLSGKQKTQLPDIRSPGEASFLAVCGEAFSGGSVVIGCLRRTCAERGQL